MSAFEIYKKQKKKPKALLMDVRAKKSASKAVSSTPLPQANANRNFTPDCEASTSASILSPIITEKRKNNKKKFLSKIKNKQRPQAVVKTNGTPMELDEPKVNPGKKLKTKNYDADHSVNQGKNLLAWILSPVGVDDFFSSYWEQRPLYIEHNTETYFSELCTIDDLFLAFKHCPMHLLKNVTVTSYENGKRITDDTPGRARSNTIRDYFEGGHSIRVLNPQTFIPNIGSIVACLQEFFRCMVGVNSYLTPAGTQGFAPHYDDIEAFVLQLEGEKHWKVYPPRSEKETLPRFSSPDFDQNVLGKPILDITLKAGDLLYFPRGFIHQARSVENKHSLHITVSSYQCNTWGDFFKIALPMALDKAIEENVELRQGIPLDFLDHLGIINPTKSADKTEIIKKASELFTKIVQHCPWDDAADQLGKEFIHSSFPPKQDDLAPSKWKKLFDKSIQNAQIRLITANSVRLVKVENDLVVYYSTDNSLEPRGEEPFGFAISEEEADVLKFLKAAYPKFSHVSQMCANKNLVPEAVEDLACALAQRALIQVEFP